MRKPMDVGYARTSTAEQIASLDAQLRDLTRAGATRIFSAQARAAGKRMGRPGPVPRSVPRSVDVAEMQRLAAAGFSPTAIAEQMGVGGTSVYRRIAQAAASSPGPGQAEAA